MPPGRRSRRDSDPGTHPRARLVEQLRRSGITDADVLRAIAETPRELFVPEQQQRHAYEDRALPIGEGQTISQPLVVAMMTQAARVGPHDRVLEIGTGSGYGAAVVARLAAHVTTVERLPDLATAARDRLDALGLDNVEVHVADGTLGWEDDAPWDAIIVTAAAPELPEPLLTQLAEGGRLVAPVGGRGSQRLLRAVRTATGTTHEDLGGVAFVPLIGEQGW